MQMKSQLKGMTYKIGKTGLRKAERLFAGKKRIKLYFQDGFF